MKAITENEQFQVGVINDKYGNIVGIITSKTAKYTKYTKIWKWMSRNANENSKQEHFLQ